MFCKDEVCEIAAPRNAGAADDNCEQAHTLLWPLVIAFMLFATSLFVATGYRLQDPGVLEKVCLFALGTGAAHLSLRLGKQRRLASAVIATMQASLIASAV